MSGDKTFESRMEAELLRLRAKEAEKKMLHDRTIGGDNVPRPSRDFIEHHTGPLRSEQELQQEARQTIERQQQEEQAAELRRSKFLKSVRENSRRTGTRDNDRSERD